MAGEGSLMNVEGGIIEGLARRVAAQPAVAVFWWQVGKNGVQISERKVKSFRVGQGFCTPPG